MNKFYKKLNWFTREATVSSQLRIAFQHLSRRFRIRTDIAVVAILSALVTTLPGNEQQATVFPVGNFGAMPDDGKDDGPAIRAAVAVARNAKHPVITFAKGVYRVDDVDDPGARAMIEVNELPEITIRGEETTLVGTGIKALFRFAGCGRVAVSGLTVDWDPLPVTAGLVVASAQDHIDLKVAPGHPLLEKPIQLLTTVDPDSKVPLRSGRLDYFQLLQKRSGVDCQVVAPDVLRIFRDPKPDLVNSTRKGQTMPAVGTSVIAFYHVRGGGAFPARDCGEIHYSDLRVYAVPGMGFAARTCGNVTFENLRVQIEPGSGRWISSTVDASHFNMIRGKVALLGCVFENMGDDGSNVHGTYAMVHERLGNRLVVLRGWGNPFSVFGSESDIGEPQGSFQDGAVLEFSLPDRRHVSGFSARILKTTDEKRGDMVLKKIELDADLPDFVVPGTIVANASEAPEFLMRNCILRRNRGQGIRISTRNAVIENCLFEENHGNGIWILCDADYGHDSISTRNVVIRNNVFRLCASAVRATAGRKPPVDPEVHENLVIENNRIERCGTRPINLQSVKGALIRGNTILGDASDPIIHEASSDVRMEENIFLPAEGHK